MIAQLCKMRSLKVIARTSVMSLKNSGEPAADRRAAAGGPPARGQCSPDRHRVRIVAQLIDAGSMAAYGQRRADRQLTDIFAIQTDVAIHIASALKAERTPTTRWRMHRSRRMTCRRAQHYLRGRHSFVRFTPEECAEASNTSTPPSVAIRDSPLRMWAAGAYVELAGIGEVSHELARSRALSAAASAIAADPDLGEAHYPTPLPNWRSASTGPAPRPVSNVRPDKQRRGYLVSTTFARAGTVRGRPSPCRRAHRLDPLTHRLNLHTTLLRAGRCEEAAPSTPPAGPKSIYT